MWLSIPNPNDYESPNLNPRRIKKGHSTPKWTDYDGAEPNFKFLSKYKKKNIFFKCLKKTSKITYVKLI